MKNAVTLLELLIVIAIIGILTAVAAPTLAHYLPGVRLNGSVRALSGNLRHAQENAVTEQKQYLIRFYPNASPVYYEERKKEGETETIIETVQLASNESMILDSTITNNQIIFSPDGGPTGNGNITLSINSISKIVNVTPAGFIKIP